MASLNRTHNESAFCFCSGTDDDCVYFLNLDFFHWLVSGCFFIEISSF